MTFTFENFIGQTVSFGSDTEPFFLLGFDGNSIGTSSDTYQPMGAHGQKTRNVRYNPRPMIATFGIVGIEDNRYSPKRLREMWQKIGKVMLPDHDGTITIENEIGTYRITARPLALPDIEKVLISYGKFKVEFVADNPFWISTERFVKKIGQLQKNACYPLSWPLRYGTFETEAIINNDTNLLLPMKIEITNEAEFIKIINLTTEEFIQIDKALGKNQTMTVDTEDCSVVIRTVDDDGNLISEENANYRLTVDSTPDMMLDFGKNHIIIENGVSGEGSVATITYSRRLVVI
ncbi:MAG: hypothetical protein ACI4KH_02475 [Oscillospiraceae bacterium]